MWVEIVTAFALLLVIDGLMPFINPEGFKRSLAQLLQLPNRSLRVIGLISMLLGVLLLYWVR